MRVIAEYNDIKLDERVRKIVGKSEVGSGYFVGVRDMEWSFRDRKKGLEAIRKLKRAKIYAYEGDE